MKKKPLATQGKRASAARTSSDHAHRRLLRARTPTLTASNRPTPPTSAVNSRRLMSDMGLPPAKE
jgi:hypothetical protein